MKKSFINKVFSLVMVTALLSQTSVTVFADFNDGFVGSPVYNDGYVGSPAFNDGFVGSSVYNDGYVDYSTPAYNDGYASSPVYNDGFVGSPVYNDGYVGSPAFNDGYAGSPTYNDGYAGSPVYNDGYVGYSTPTYNDGYVGYASPSYNDGYVGVTQSYAPPVYTSNAYDYNSTVSWTGYSYPGSTYVTPVTQVVPVTPVIPITPVVPVVPAPVICPAGTTFINGSCQLPSICPAGTTFINGTCQINTTVCPSGTTLINGTCQINSTSCPTGTTFINGACVGQTTTVCPNGSTLVNGICQINSTYCPAGTSLVNGACQVNAIVCPTGSVYTNGGCFSNVPIYQTCWDGSRIPNTSVCPSQYKICNGASVPIYQTCRIINPYPPYIPPQVVKFNNVVTAPVTEITNKSARCNGIGLIANGAQSTGWFEYGETANLGRETASAAIGSALTSPFSNVLSNLKPQTSYYCRAAMKNQYGTFKGEIVRFTTKQTAVKYVKTVSVVKKTYTKPAKKNEIVCVDGTSVSVGQSTAALINQGQKLIALQMEKVSGNIAADASDVYKLTYKNLSDENLSGVIIRVTVPEEVLFPSTTAGSYDPTTRTITFTPGMLPASAEGVMTWTGNIAHNAIVGKTIVTTAYASYTVPGTQTQDEVTAYMTGSVVSPDAAINTGAKKVIGTSDRGFLPGSLVEWLALIAILFIILILGRSIYASYKEEDSHAH